jgi:drug/metabolite transporter (DMT)-like permease
MILIATLGGLGALLGWGLSDYFAGKSGQQTSVLLTNLILQSVGVFVLLPIIMWKGLSLELNVSLLIIAASALCFSIAHISFIRSMSIGPFGVAAPIGNAYALVTLSVGILFFQLQLSSMQLFALLAIIAGVIVLAVDRTTFDYKKFRGSTVAFALITMMSWGFAFVLVDRVVADFAWYELAFLIGVCVVLFSFIAYVLVHRTLPKRNLLVYRNARHAWRAGLLVGVGVISFYSASEYVGSVVVPAVIASASPLVTSFMAYLRDRERLQLYKRIGAVIIVAGLVLLNVFP